MCVFCRLHKYLGSYDKLVGLGTALQAAVSRFRFPIMSLGIFIDIILPAAQCPWGRLRPQPK